MRILWLNANLLLPLDKGGKLRTWHLMRHLAARHDITYLAFADPSALDEHRDGMRQVCADLVTVPRRDTSKASVRFYGRVVKHLADPVPYAVAQYRSTAYRRALETLIATGRFDRVVCDFLVPAVNMPRRLSCPSALFTHNVEAEIWRRHAETTTSRVRQRLYASQWKRMLRFEGRTLARFDRVLAVSEADRDTFQRLYPRQLAAPVSVIPTGVDTAYFDPAPGTSANPRHLVFVGSMDWLPNEDGVVDFCRSVLPLIRRDEPDVTLSIVGRSPTPAVRRLADDPSIEVTGSVDDVRPHLQGAAVSVVPLRIAGGTRLKIFESMAAGTAVVSTTIGAEGLPLEPGRHVLLADDAASFAKAVVALLRDPARRRAIEDAARVLVTSRYDWGSVAGELEQALVNTTFATDGDRSVVVAPTRGSLHES